ncbi:MAG: replication factor A [Haloquadratum walsbyi J07HQW2]|uniref:Replication factor A n=2 Tax=Haloquadratum walsbyi TaxID=293091 RepID=U1MVX1_9EURY|nr:MAG: replication factor A [Haloquadratum walsbyi J07HQW2]
MVNLANIRQVIANKLDITMPAGTLFIAGSSNNASMDVDDHAEELASTLGVDKAEVKSDLENLVAYSVPVDEAKQSIRRKYGNDTDSGAMPSAKDIEAVETGDGNVTVTVRVITVGCRTIQYQGEEQAIREGVLADETGTIPYTAWQDFGFESGDSITIGNAGVREWDGQPELNIGQSSTVAVETDSVSVVEHDLPCSIGGYTSLLELAPGNRGRVVEVEIIELEKRVINGRNGETTIHSGVIADESGRLPFTDWEARSTLSAGETFRFDDVYIREFRGAPQVNLSSFTTVEALSKTVEVNQDAQRVAIGEAVDSGGVFDAEVTGTVLEVREGSGLIERCPECNRALQSGQCREHGSVEGEDDMRVKAIIDDGTGAVTAILDRELTESIYGGSMDEAMTVARDAMDKSVIAEEIRSTIVGREYRIRGNISVDEYGANLETAEFERTSDDPATRAKSVLEEVTS